VWWERAGDRKDGSSKCTTENKTLKVGGREGGGLLFMLHAFQFLSLLSAGRAERMDEASERHGARLATKCFDSPPLFLFCRCLSCALWPPPSWCSFWYCSSPFLPLVVLLGRSPACRGDRPVRSSIQSGSSSELPWCGRNFKKRKMLGSPGVCRVIPAVERLFLYLLPQFSHTSNSWSVCDSCALWNSYLNLTSFIPSFHLWFIYRSRLNLQIENKKITTPKKPWDTFNFPQAAAVTHLRSGRRRWHRCAWWATGWSPRAGRAPSSRRWGPAGAWCPPSCWSSASGSSAGTSTHTNTHTCRQGHNAAPLWTHTKTTRTHLVAQACPAMRTGLRNKQMAGRPASSAFSLCPLSSLCFRSKCGAAGILHRSAPGPLLFMLPTSPARYPKERSAPERCKIQQYGGR